MENKNFDSKEHEADDIIKRHVYWSVGAGLTPIPLLDIAAVTAIQLDMLKSICELYEIDYSKEQGKSWISSLVGSTLSSVLARLGASAIKTIPAVGTAIGMASMSILSGSTTYAIGNVFVNHFEGGGTLGNFNAEKVKNYYKQKVEDGKKLASELKDKYIKFAKSKKGKEKENNATAKLKELQKLKKNDLISEDEYENMRSDILKTLLSDK